MAGNGCLIGGGVELEVLGGGGLRVVLGHLSPKVEDELSGGKVWRTQMGRLVCSLWKSRSLCCDMIP